MLVDTHCHLGDGQFESDRDAVVQRARDQRVGHIVVIADSLAGSQSATMLAHHYGFSATAGVHPHQASSWSDATHETLVALLDEPAVVAVGEAGLDYYYEHSPRTTQRRVFAKQLEMAASKSMPVVVHARDADADMAAFVRDWGTDVPAFVLHSFSSGPSVFEAGMDVGAYFGFSGMVTFKNWQHTPALVSCPIERLLLETDAPYLAPVPHRGKRNEPAYVRLVAARTAELRNTALEDIEHHTTLNAGRCFGARVLELSGEL